MLKYTLNEVIHDGFHYNAEINDIMHSSQSQFQAVDVVESKPLGRCLVLDTKIQSAEMDEFVYHESLVHPAMIMHPDPKNVFIGGGGEGATLREVLRHKTVEKCTMVDIDGVAVEVSRQFLSRHGDGAFSNPRAKLVIDDAKAWLEKCDEQFDVMIFDLADPVDNGPCFLLYAVEFYRDVVLPRLKPGGLFVTQSGPAGILSSSQVHTAIVRTVGDSFKHAQSYTSFMQSFCDMYGFTVASQEPLPVLTVDQVNQRLQDRLVQSEAEIKQARVAEAEYRAKQGYADHHLQTPAVPGAVTAASLSFYDGTTHIGMFSLPIYLRKAIAEEKRRITNDTPLYLT